LNELMRARLWETSSQARGLTRELHANHDVIDAGNDTTNYRQAPYVA
jgi:hypothetical protein